MNYEHGLTKYGIQTNIKPAAQDFCHFRLRQSHDVWRAYSLFAVQVASFAPEASDGANDARRDTNKLYARKKSFDYHYYQYTGPNRTNSFKLKRKKVREHRSSMKL